MFSLMKKLRLLLFLVAFTLLAMPAAYAQDITVTGKVTDKETNLPLEGASVSVKGSNAGGTVDAQGNYTIKVPPTGALVFTFLGYATQEVAVNNRTTINLQLLKSNSKDMDGVVVVGYRTVQRKDVTGAVSSIDVKDLQDVPAASLVNLLAGKAP